MEFVDPKRWDEIGTLFAQALERPGGERAVFFDTVCSGDPLLRREVERLLEAHDSAGGFLESLDRTRAAALIDATTGDDEPPEIVAAYRIIRRLGGGGMGVVYLGHDSRLERPVALKLLRTRFGSDEGARRRLMAEARAASALDHPHIMPVYEIGELPDGRLFIAMAYGGAESLAERIRRGPLAPREAAELARQIADALAAAHRHGIVHRDVKPANVIVADGRARLVDFGIALVAGLGAPSMPGAAGTLAYISPEQARGDDVDHKSDLWSFGVVLYEMLTGRRPFSVHDHAAPGKVRPHRAAQPVRAPRPEVPERLARIAESCLAMNPADRPPGAAAIVTELDAFLRDDASAVQSARRRATWPLLAAAIVLAASAAAFLLLTDRDGVPEGTDGPMLAVLPFAPTAADTALERLGRELAITLGTSLDGAAGIRVVEPTAVLAQAGRASAIGLEAAAELARGLGAQRIVHGRLARSGLNVRLDAAIYALPDLTVLARAAAIAPADDISALTDSATIGLLVAREYSREARAPNLAAITTSSVPALRAYLEGELAIAGARFRAAPLAFARAIEADSTFWFAYWRYVYALSYHGQPADSAIAAAVVEHRTELPEPDRLLVEARLAGGQRERLRMHRAITGRYPTYWPAWFDLGDQLTHHGAFLGQTFEEARSALERTVELNPRFVPAWEHLFWIAVHTRDSVSSGRILTRLAELRLDSLLQDDWDLETLDYYRYLDHLARSDGEPRRADAEVGARVLTGYNGPLDAERLATSLTNYGFHRAQIDLGRRVHALGGRPRVLAAQTWAAALSWAGRGAWDSAFASLQHYARVSEHPRGPIWAFGIAATGASIGALNPDSALALREVAIRSEPARTPEGAAEIAWLEGLLACARGDAAGLARQREKLATAPAPGAPTLTRSLAAFEHALAGRRDQAARALAQLEWANADSAWAFRFGSAHPLLVAVNRLAAGDWLLEAGDTAQAARLLLLHETDLPGALHPLPAIHLILGTLALPELSRIEDARGRPERARHYRALFEERSDLASQKWRTASPRMCRGSVG